MAIVEETASALSDVIAATSRIRKKWNPTGQDREEMWFRGQAKRFHELVPGIYRQQARAYGYDEFTLVTHFRGLGAPYCPSTIKQDLPWDWYFLAQHYRLPTRLLDWTESLLVGIYFAIETSMRDHDRALHRAKISAPKNEPIFDDDSPSVWVIDAGSLNVWSGHSDAIFAPGSGDIDTYCWDEFQSFASTVSDDSPRPEWPVAIAPTYQNPRIIAQRGMFTVHGIKDCAIDRIATDQDPAGTIKLARITLDRANLHYLWQEIELLGAGRFSFFPELDSVAEHLKSSYQ